MALNRFHVVSPIALMAFSACRSPFVQGGSVGGAVVNGPLDSALVCRDYDFAGICSSSNHIFVNDYNGNRIHIFQARQFEKNEE